MKNLKQKIKRALAGFLRDELLEYIGYNHKIPFMSLNDRFIVNELPFETMVMEVQVPLFDERSYNPIESQQMFEKQIEDAKRKFASQMMDHIHVDARDLTSREHYMRRSIKLVLRVQGKKY
jgi:hypothetical protein